MTNGGWTRRAVVVRAAQTVVAVLLFVLLWRLADGPDAARTLATANPGWLLLAAGLLLLHTVLAALRWRVTAAALGIELTQRQAISEYFLSQLVNTTLPGGVLGDAGRAARSRHDSGLGNAAGAVVIERAIGQLALLVVWAAGFAATLAIPTGVVWPAPVAVVVTSMLVGVTVALLGLFVGLRRAQPRPGTRLDRIVDGLRRSLVAPGVLRRQVALSAGTTACILGAFACCVLSVGASFSLAATAVVVPLVLFAMLLPISIGGWGVREGAAVALLPIAGLTPSQALAASIAFGIVALVVALPGLLAVWAGRRTRPPHPMMGSRRIDLPHPHASARPEEFS